MISLKQAQIFPAGLFFALLKLQHISLAGQDKKTTNMQPPLPAQQTKKQAKKLGLPAAVFLTEFCKSYFLYGFFYMTLQSETVNLKRTLQAILHGFAKRKNCRSLSEPSAGWANASGKSLSSAIKGFFFFCVLPLLYNLSSTFWK